MGQRSQIYVRTTDNKGNTALIARYFQWNYGERMISRARYTIEWLKGYAKYFTEEEYSFCRDREIERLISIINTNFDYKDVTLSTDLLTEAEKYTAKGDDFADWLFNSDNNDGKLFVDLTSDGNIKYCFFDYNNNTENIMDAEAYYKWDTDGWKEEYKNDPELKELNEKNAEYINANAQLMTAEEITEFLTADYRPIPKF